MLRILLVEDNPADAQMLQTALGRTGMPIEVTHLDDGAKAIEYLEASCRNFAAPDSDIVLLDLNLPRVGGFEVLEYIRRSEPLRSLPVVILSGSTNSDEIDHCYQAGANSYICKPIHLDEIFSATASFVTYWSHCVKLPSQRLVGHRQYMTASQIR